MKANPVSSYICTIYCTLGSLRMSRSVANLDPWVRYGVVHPHPGCLIFVENYLLLNYKINNKLLTKMICEILFLNIKENIM